MKKQDNEKKEGKKDKKNRLPEKTRKIDEISPEAKEERRLLSKFLLDNTEELTKERNERKEKAEKDKIELNSGDFISLYEIKQFITANKPPYVARFPNDNPFFKNMFRLHPHLAGQDPNKFQKKRLAGRLLKKLTYDTFPIEVLPALRVLAMPGGIRLHKCHEFLTERGVEHLLKSRDISNIMMEKYNDLEWYEFDKEFSSKNKKPFQPNLGDC